VADVRAILVVPAEAWRERLLGDGPCGARVPMARAVQHFHTMSQYNSGACSWCLLAWPCPDAGQAADAERWFEGDDGPPGTRALALAWDGRSTGPEGLARALACLAKREGRDGNCLGCERQWGPMPWMRVSDVSSGLGRVTAPCWAMGWLRYAPPHPNAPDEWWWGGSSHRPDVEVPALATPPDGLGDLLDLWALATVLVARGIAERVEVTRG
jgi:hypothetical protein